VDSRDIARRRMHSQRLWGTPFERPDEVVEWMAAVQSQDFPVAKWSVAQRAKDVGDAAMDRAFADGAILRTHVLRPTWHFVLPADIRWMLELTAPRVNALNAHYYRKLGLDDELFARSNELIARALKGGAQLTRKEVAAELGRAGIATSGLQLGYILMRAELDAVICSGALRGKQHTYASLDERAPDAKALDRDGALAELTGRYFTSRGPATVKDYVRWSSLTAADGRRGLDMVKSRLGHEVVDGRTYWFAASSKAVKAGPKVIDLVQGLDECVMSYSESRDVLAPPSATLPDEAAFKHVVLLDGRVIGRWRRAPKRSSVVVETDLYRRLVRVQRQALDVAVERYGRFLGVPATLV
jgi:hypothetical protein